jgi:hypothetical protein
MYHSQAKNATQDTPDTTSMTIMTPEDQAKSIAASMSAVTSRSDAVRSRALPTKSSRPQLFQVRDLRRPIAEDCLLIELVPKSEGSPIAMSAIATNPHGILRERIRSLSGY